MKNYLVPVGFLLIALCLGGVYMYQYNKDSLLLQQTDPEEIMVLPNEPYSTAGVTDAENLPLSELREKGFSEEQIIFFKKVADKIGDKEYVRVVQSPLSADIAYVNPGSYLDKNTYTVNKKTGTIQIIETVSPQKAESDEYIFRLIGMKDSSVLFIKQHTEDSPSPCWNPWVFIYTTQQDGTYSDTEARRIKALDINSGELIDFMVSEEKRDIEWKKVEECNAGISE